MTLRHPHLEPVWYSYSFLRNFILAYPIYAIMMLESGVTPFGLSVLFVAWSVTALVAEVPSGVLADVYPRRNVLVAASLLKAAGFGCWLAGDGVGIYLAGFVLWGTGGAAASGAREALLFDALAQNHRTSRFGRVYGRGEAVAEFGTVTAFMIGGAAAEFGFGVPLAASVAVSCAVAVLLLVAIKEPPRAGDGASAPDRFVATLRAGMRQVAASRRVAVTVAAMMLLGSIYGVYEEYVTPYLRSTGFDLTRVGLVAALVYGARAAGTFCGGQLGGERDLGRALALYAASGLCLLAAGLLAGQALVAALLAWAFVCGVADVRLQTNLQHAISSGSRATVTSLAGLGAGLWAVILYLAAGATAEAGGWPLATLTFAALTAAMLVPLTWLQRQLPA